VFLKCDVVWDDVQRRKLIVARKCGNLDGPAVLRCHCRVHEWNRKTCYTGCRLSRYYSRFPGWWFAHWRNDNVCPLCHFSHSRLLNPPRAALINSTLATCPSTLLTLSGYSQGAELVHLATSQLPANTTSRISSVVLFGDPKNGTALNGIDAKRVMTICHSGDDICKGGDDVGLAHLNYSADAGTAAMFALSGVAQVGITSQRMKFRGGNSIG
jgi:cutinase